MAPLPKRRHSTRRQGKREKANLAIRIIKPNICQKCGHPKQPHRLCGKCGNY